MSDPVVYRYTGPTKRRRPPFAGVPMRDLTARDVARLPVGMVQTITGGETTLYVPVKAKAADPPKPTAAGGAAPEKPATAEKE